MEFKERSRVEVFRNKAGQYGSWFSATISSAHACGYTVRYESCLTKGGEALVENVHEEDVRPHPSSNNGRKKWVAGDLAEVFDLHSWRLAKIAKVLKNKQVVVRMFGSIQLKGFPILGLRVPQAWQNNQWVAIEKTDQNQLERFTSPTHKHTSVPGYGAHEWRSIEGCTAHRCANYRSLSTQRNDMDKNRDHGFRVLSDALDDRTSKKRKRISKMDSFCQLTNRPLLEEQATALKDAACVNSDRQQIECSVASCSANYPEPSNEEHTRKIVGFPNGLSDDAMSVCPSTSWKNCRGHFDRDRAANIHRLEMQAYRSTVLAFYASGPLTWEQESLLTNLRISLNISNEEHLLQVRHLLSS